MQIPARYRFHLSLLPLLSIVSISVLIFSYPELPSDFPVTITPVTAEVLSWAPKSHLLVLKAPLLALLIQLISLILFFHFDKIFRMEKVTGRITFLNLEVCYLIQISSLIKALLYSLSFLNLTPNGFLTEGKILYVSGNLITIFQMAFIGVVLWKIYKGDIDKNMIVSNLKTNSRIYINNADPFIFNSNHYLNFGRRTTYLLLALMITIPVLLIVIPLVSILTN
ncbi:MAG TPA: hypothetical protein VIK89_00175 [Cytophagaceae bacterium]